METLYFSTPFQIFHDVFIRQAWLVDSIFESSEILGIFDKAYLHSLVDQVRHRSLSFCCFEPKSTVKHRVKIYCCSFGITAHRGTNSTISL